MSEKEYYNELVLQEYYHKLFDEEIETNVIKPLKAAIINTFTGFSGGCAGGHKFVDDNGNEVKVIYRVTNDNYSSLIEENEKLKQALEKLKKTCWIRSYEV